MSSNQCVLELLKLSSNVNECNVSPCCLVLTGPVSEAAAAVAMKRCKRAGVWLVMAAAEGTPTDAKAGQGLTLVHSLAQPEPFPT